MTGQRRISIVMFLSMMIVMTATAGAKTQTGFLNRIAVIDRVTYKYQVYVPAEWSKDKKWPVILFLHGAGERGEDGLLQTQVGIATAIRTRAERFPCIVVIPQCRKNIWWTEPMMEAQALKALDQSMKEFRGDPDRVYLTGLSMGGYGTWGFASRNPGKFAALAPICGGVRLPERASSSREASQPDPKTDPYAEVAQKVGKTPVWIFHGGADPVVPPSESQKMKDSLKTVGGNVKYTEYDGVGHNSWDRAYAEPEFMPWLLSQRRSR